MAGLGEQLWELPHTWETERLPQGGVHAYPSLCEPNRITLKIKQRGAGRIEATVRQINLQRVMDKTDPTKKRRGARVRPDERTEESVNASRRRARVAVRSICQRMNADRLCTFGTRSIISIGELLCRFTRFIDAYEYATGEKWLRCAVPELHKDGVHYHLHVATTGWFHLSKALNIWHSLCANDDFEHEVNGSINVKYFTLRTAQDDVATVIANYIAKYVGKSLEAEFNKKKYWSSRMGKEEIDHVILRSKTLVEAQKEVSALLGVDWSSVILTHKGCWFVFPDESGFWFRLTPNMHRSEIPF